jgi:hypothetical protein
MQIMLLWNENDPWETKLVDRLKKGFDKIGCWRVTLPAQGSIYKEVLVLDETTVNKEDK